MHLFNSHPAFAYLHSRIQHVPLTDDFTLSSYKNLFASVFQKEMWDHDMSYQNLLNDQTFDKFYQTVVSSSEDMKKLSSKPSSGVLNPTRDRKILDSRKSQQLKSDVLGAAYQMLRKSDNPDLFNIDYGKVRVLILFTEGLITLQIY